MAPSAIRYPENINPVTWQVPLVLWKILNNSSVACWMPSNLGGIHPSFYTVLSITLSCLSMWFSWQDTEMAYHCLLHGMNRKYILTIVKWYMSPTTFWSNFPPAIGAEQRDLLALTGQWDDSHNFKGLFYSSRSWCIGLIKGDS